jgi:hypothetical protein
MVDARICPDCGGRGVYAGTDGRTIRCATCSAISRLPGGTTIEVQGENASEVEEVSRKLTQDAHERYAARRVGPWVSGSFYLLALLLVLAMLAIIANVVALWVLPAVIIGGLIGPSVVGALQLRHDEGLSEQGFLKLMGLTLRQLPLIRPGGKDPDTQ